MATAGLRLGIPKKVMVLSLDTPGWLWNFLVRNDFVVFIFQDIRSRL